MAIVVRGYFDCSGQLTANGWVTLAGYTAAPRVWSEFGRRWNEILGAAPVQPCSYLHMREAWPLRDGFCRSKGWTREAVNALLRRLMQCLADHGWGEEAEEECLFGVYCTIEEGNWSRACENLPFLAEKGLVAVCADYVALATLRRLPQDPGRREGYRLGEAELCFDRGELFEGAIETAWSAARSRPSGSRGPLSMFSKPESADMRQTPGLQAADFLAWHVNRWHRDRCQQSNLRAVLSCPGVGDRFDHEKLMAWYQDGDPMPWS